MLPLNILVEGQTDELLLKRLLQDLNLPVGRVYGKKGKPHLLERLPNYNRAAQHSPWLVVLDLDHDADCAPSYLPQILPQPALQMYLRLAVRAIESWLLADADRLAQFFGISASRIPVQPDLETDPKATLIHLARRSRKKAIHTAFVPRPESGAKVGPGYVSGVFEFVTPGQAHSWRPRIAAERSASLRRCVQALAALQAS